MFPFSEDDCMRVFGYWTDDEWAGGGVIVSDGPQPPDPAWLTAVEFMSGAIVIVQADSAAPRLTLFIALGVTRMR